jgi:hypothetical protein
MREAEVRPWTNAGAKHINFQLRIQQNRILYLLNTKYGDSSDAVRSMLKTISAVKGNKNNKREA